MPETKAFIDTNILLYLLSEDSNKADRAETIVRAGGTISVQVIFAKTLKIVGFFPISKQTPSRSLLLKIDKILIKIVLSFSFIIPIPP